MHYVLITMLTIVHSGQSGVERGAYRAAVAMGVHVTGVMRSSRRDGFGTVPGTVAARLVASTVRGPRQAVVASVALASAVVVVVPDAEMATQETGIADTLKAVRAAKLPFIVWDPKKPVAEVIDWTKRLAAGGPLQLMVTGPRETRWQGGETAAWRLVAAIATH